jgi:hypothetical protein
VRDSRFRKAACVRTLAVVLAAAAAGTAEDRERPRHLHPHSLEASPISPLFDIYALQYLHGLGSNGEGILGLAYTAVEYDFGRNHAPTVILGYRHYFWRELHAEYQLWPAYNFFYGKDEDRYYNGFDLWNEFRAGYAWDFRFRGQPFYVNLQVLAGFGLYEGNKPESFREEAEENPLFVAPVFFLGWRF